MRATRRHSAIRVDRAPAVVQHSGPLAPRPSSRVAKPNEEQMANRFGRLALHMWTIDTTPLAAALDAARAAGYGAVEQRRIDFKRCYEAGMSNAQVLDLVRRSGIAVGVLGVEYGWLFAKGEESKRIF